MSECESHVDESDEVLVLNMIRKDSNNSNDFADFNAQMLLKHFGGGRIFYVLESVFRNGIANTQEKISKIIEERSISTVVFAPNGSDYELPIEYFAEIKASFGVRTILWMLDDELCFDTYSKYYAQVFDAVVTCDYYATFAYAKLGVPAFYYFSSYSKSQIYPYDVPRDLDVSFVGDCTKADRISMIEYLRANEVRVVTYGDGSDFGFVDRQEMIKIFSRSKINLNFTKVNTLTAQAWFLEENCLSALVRQNKGRPMEVAMTRSFCLSEYSSSLAQTFTIGSEMDMFGSREELLERVRYYLKEDEIREQMAERAYRKALAKYEADVFFHHLVGQICSACNEHRYWQRSGSVLKDSVFKKNHIINLTIIMYHQLFHGRLMIALETMALSFQYGLWVWSCAFANGTMLAFQRMLLKAQNAIRKQYFRYGHHLLEQLTKNQNRS